jgi:hypothetical protein
MSNRFQLRIEVADGFVWATVFHDQDEFLSERLDRLTRENLEDLACLVSDGAESDIRELMTEVARG